MAFKIECEIAQTLDKKDKIYGISASETKCISKGKAHKPYELGLRANLESSSYLGWILGFHAHYGDS